MKTISLCQPWATLLAIEATPFDTRRYTVSYRGPLAIHAGNVFPSGAQALCLQSPFKEILADAGYSGPDDLPYGAVIAVTDLEEIVPAESLRTIVTPQQLALGHFITQYHAWRHSKVRRLATLIPAVGSPGLFEVFIPGYDVEKTQSKKRGTHADKP